MDAAKEPVQMQGTKVRQTSGGDEAAVRGLPERADELEQEVVGSLAALRREKLERQAAVLHMTAPALLEACRGSEPPRDATRDRPECARETSPPPEALILPPIPSNTPDEATKSPERVLPSDARHSLTMPSITSAFSPAASGPVHREPLKVGSRVGDYDVIKLIGAGGFSEVWLVRDPRTGLERAFKTPKGGASDSAALGRVLEEAATLRGFGETNHDGFVTVHDVRTSAPPVGIFLEYLPQSLDADIGAGLQVALDDLRQIVPIITTLHTHSNKTIHGDIKPTSFRKTAEGKRRLKMVDVYPKYSERAFAITESIVCSGSLCAGADEEKIRGTLLRLAPEQHPDPRTGKPAGVVSERTDVYHLAGLFIELLTGNYPAGYVELPAELAALTPVVINKARNQDPLKRQATPQAFLEEVEAALSRWGGSTDVAPSPSLPAAAKQADFVPDARALQPAAPIVLPPIPPQKTADPFGELPIPGSSKSDWLDSSSLHVLQIRQLRSGDSWKRADVIRSLDESKDPFFLAYLRDFGLSDKHGPVREASLHALKKANRVCIAKWAATVLAEGRRSIVQTAAVELLEQRTDRDSLEALQSAAVRARKVSLRERSVGLLSKPSILPLVPDSFWAAAMRDGASVYIRYTASKALKGHSSPEGLKALVRGLSDEEEAVRVASAEGLSSRREGWVAGALRGACELSLFERLRNTVRRRRGWAEINRAQSQLAALAALDGAGGPQLEALIVRILNNEKSSPAVFTMALRMAKAFDSPSMMSTVNGARVRAARMWHENRDPVWAAAETLAASRIPAAQMALCTNWILHPSLQAVGSTALGAATKLPETVVWLRDIGITAPDDDIVRASLRALDGVENRSVNEALLTVLRQRRGETASYRYADLRVGLVKALHWKGAAAEREVLLELLKEEAVQRPSQSIFTASVAALPDSDAKRDLLIAVIQHVYSNKVSRYHALNFPSCDAIDTLIRQPLPKSQDVLYALRKIGDFEDLGNYRAKVREYVDRAQAEIAGGKGCSDTPAVSREN